MKLENGLRKKAQAVEIILLVSMLRQRFEHPLFGLNFAALKWYHFYRQFFLYGNAGT